MHFKKFKDITSEEIISRISIENLLLINKPTGVTSTQVVGYIKKKTRLKTGHSGTLDPMASGLMILGVGKGTKLLTNLIKQDKQYLSEITLGFSTSTWDIEGSIVDERNVTEVSLELVDTALKEIMMIETLPVPAFSAIKINGHRLYDLARKKKDIILPERKMKIYAFKILDIKYSNNRTIINVSFDVGSGTYIRSIAHKLGSILNVPSTLTSLQRIQVGTYSLDQSFILETEDRM